MARTNKIGTHCTTVSTADGRTTVTYHETDVVTFDDLTVKLDNGGWPTSTTKLRMNQASIELGLGFWVYQYKKQWFVDTPTQEAVPFDPQGRIQFNR